MYTEDDDDRKINNLYDDYDDYDDSNEDEGGSSGNFEFGNSGSSFRGFGNFLGNAGKAVKNVAKVVAKVAKAFVALPTPVKVIIIVLFVAIIAFIIVDVNKKESTNTVTYTVDTTVETMEEKLKDPDLTNEEKEKIKKAIEHFEKNNSYLYFTINDINDSYETLKEQYSESVNDVQSSTYESLSTKFGSNQVDGDNENSRIVDSNQKLELYKHLLMTEKYNFNKVKWYWYGHGHNGDELTVANGTLQEDRELGIIYPNDGTTKLETFIKLLSPNMQTWHIPLAFHSGFITKSGSDEAASKFTYSVIRDAYSDIVVNRYDKQKYTLNTTFNDYMETKYKSRFSYNIAVTTTYKARLQGVNNKTYEYLGISSFTKDFGSYTLSNIADEGKYKESLIYSLTQGVGYTFNADNNQSILINENNCVRWNTNAETTFSSCMPENEYYAITDITLLKNSTTNAYTGEIIFTFVKYNIGAISTTEYEKDSNGNIIYDVYYKYSYSPGQILEPYKVDSKYVNERAVEGQENKKDSEIDPMKEKVESSFTNVVKSYYINTAKTFDVNIANEYNYIRYNENDANNRVNPKTNRETHVEDYYKEVDNRNKLTMSVFKDTANTSLEDLSKVFNRIEIEGNRSFNNNSNLYAILKSVSPNTEIKDSTTTTSNVVGIPNSNGFIVKTESYTNIYQNKNEYIIQEGKAKDKQGTHYVQRTWEDTLTQKSQKKETYTTDDLVDFNVKYNSKLNNTSESKEKENFDKKIKKSQASYSEYETLAELQELNNVDFINSNSNIFDDYLIDTNQESQIMGYNREWLKVGLDELKRLFEETVNEKGTIPYVYGISLGLTNLLKSSTKNELNSGAGLFGWPTDNEYISCIQGDSARYGEPHDGVDIWATYDGDNQDYTEGKYPTYAIADGEVILANDLGIVSNGEHVSENKLGNYIVIKHDNGYISRYGHLFAGTFTVKKGDKVKRGQEIAKLGSSGNSECLHLHFNIFDNSDGDNSYSDADRLDPLEFYRIEPVNGNTITYEQLLADESLRNQISNFNMYKYAGPLGTGEITDGKLPDLTDSEKSELISELKGTNVYNFYSNPDNSDFGKLENVWLWQYYKDNPIELIARIIYSEFTSSEVKDETLVYMLAAHAHSIVNHVGSPENVYNELTTTNYALSMGSDRFVSPDIPKEYRQIAAAAIDGTLPYPPGYVGNEEYWIGTSDWVDGTYSNHDLYHKVDETCAYIVGISFHAFLSENNSGKYGLLVPSNEVFSSGRFAGKPRAGLNEDMKIADGVYVNEAAGGSTERNYEEILEIISRY